MNLSIKKNLEEVKEEKKKINGHYRKCVSEDKGFNSQLERDFLRN